ncbi:MAG: hypothetical protein UU81_C0008G0006 [Microgenomates group bacterium GW2011_GWC1_41_8]|uniref:Uncharacterized protein n=3 Tax=Candidatus Roizmaniibacteriota TaxID=1752723 RepID=A0A0G1A6Q1_9BACT|nr:MAG: hypothetical protein UU14_C0010G0009 [Candidatus Roizmanbacteria bacterium GW2011_GWB1_40_7]KKR94135.1 MAG: hypothetical protein UU41_C0012G0017 [Candidatus Roizmanbacteria bacterium GW2011_GWA1_41_13]KKS21023.1 MAG: hypothetical protein UU78_C0045G0006 [Candidatus Roizmanbacteria bacterium GW2011_GWC2_41_7]KKS24390.1 MAG: hypothetical protein UU81_C0008G0006 [Microgenomates group bacterium GW2011_GWC1_41_8]OGK50323.1 MAG: hypothetical protein A3A55_01335 [Candidatus Roizmanbacteria bac
MTKLLLTGSDTEWGSDAYNQAVTEGMIGLIGLMPFMEMADHEIIGNWYGNGYRESLNESALQVKHVRRGGKERELVIKEWFGTKISE